MREGYFIGDELEEALVFLQDGEPTPNDLRVLQIVMEFKRAAE